MTVMLGIAAVLIPSVSAFGYGISSISFTQQSANVSAGSNALIGYTVNLASGSTWGTTLSVVNGSALALKGISVALSTTSGDPPFSGTMMVRLAQYVTSGSYSIILRTSGDDPSPNATFVVNVPQNGTARGAVQQTTALTTVIQNSSANSTATAPATTVSAVSSTAYTVNPGGTITYSNSSSNAYGLMAAVVVILIVCSYLAIRMNYMSAKLIWTGVALILIGVVVWLYGDYNGGLMPYIWGGVAAIIVGTAIWLVGDQKGGAFKMRK
jgi:hypothetical protein